MRGLAGKRAIVTGGASGIGKAIATRLAEEGCHVGIFDLNLDAAEAVARDLTSTACKVDVTDYGSAGAGVARFEADAGPCDILINCAGWDAPRLFLETAPGDWDKVIAINLRGPLNLQHAVCPGMAARRWGRVVNIASDAGRVGAGLTAVYSAAKGGLIAFTKSLARELATSGVTVNAVAPGPTRTPLLAASFGDDGDRWLASVEKAIPMKRLGEPEDIAGITAFLASDDAGYITGQVISVSGGLTMAG
jgi:2-hydroxycyclohexanecarboxyl-CoA dehydrogenase